MSEPGKLPSARRSLVWIVDDSPTERMITERSLGDQYDYERFGDGSIAVERLAQGGRQPDLVLCDWMMPGMNGDEVCRFLRSNPTTRDLPIILVTASRVETSDVVSGLASGANDYVARPFVPEELRARVDAALRAKQMADSCERERLRLGTINRLGRALFEASTDVDRILDELATALTQTICDGCSILLLPGSVATGAVTRHNADRSGATLEAVAQLADPVVHSFESSAHARTTLPPAYVPYIHKFGLRGLAILPLPNRDPLRGVVTVTRDGNSDPFDASDIATIETCIEYASLAVESAARFEAERLGREQKIEILTSLPVGVIVTDADGRLSLVNAAAIALIPGIGAAADLGVVFAITRWATIDGVAMTEQDWRLLVTESQRTETLMRLPGDTVSLAVAISGVSLRDGHGMYAGSVTLIQDISAEHAINAERERTGQFQQQMLGIVGHDLRTPLGAILMGSELLKMSLKENPSAASVIKRIESSANRMTRMVDQLLDVTRARLGDGIPVVPRAMHLLPVIKSVMEEMSLTHTKSSFELVATSDVSGLWDPDRFGQVVSNVMSNAVHYGLEGAPIVVGVTSSDVAATITVHNQIRDKPISPEAIATLFDPYRRGGDNEHNSTGLGLGLYIVHEIVRAHGGTMDVESSYAGTTFRVVLPKAGPPIL